MAELSRRRTSPSAGRVFLIGAGPGDPSYITLRGVACLARADVILYDYLVNPAILKHARPDAELICLGQHGRTRIWSQEEVNAELVALAQAGKQVARLKSGDSTIFARVAEELQTLTEAGIPYEIVPGITAALAAGSCAGIPLTHRDFASAVALITGHENDTKESTSLDYEALARFPGTLVFYMGVTTAQHWTSALIAAGKPPETPAALVRRCSFSDQRTILCRLDEVVARMTQPEKMRPPVIVVVGEVTQFSSTYSWFEQRPLFGRRVVVTRPLDQCEALAGPLAELGAEVLSEPAIRIEPPADSAPLDAALEQLASFDWIVFSSANGVRMLLERLLALGRDLRSLAHPRLAAIGPGTAEELTRYHLRADLVPADDYRAESLVSALVGPTGDQAAGKNFLLVRASRGREVLSAGLTAAGGRVEQVVAYRSDDVREPDARVAALLAEGKIDWVTVTSSAIARSLVALHGESLRRTKLVSISPITTATLAELGYTVAAEASEYTMPGVVAAILQAESVD
jgi:uroporphyrinogen III methyltransferase/synthase